MRRVRVYAEICLSALSLLALVLTLVWDKWIEAVLGVEPDGGDGSAEWMVFVACAVLALGSALLARIEIRRLAGTSRATA